MCPSPVLCDNPEMALGLASGYLDVGGGVLFQKDLTYLIRLMEELL